MRVLLTGGTGYIGSHVAVALIESGHEPILVDNLSNSSIEVLEGIEKITGERLEFYEGDIRHGLDELFRDVPFHAVIHLAGYKSVEESFRKPLSYYGNNLGATFAVLHAMRNRNVNNMVFSSSATVYGPLTPVPYQEHYELDARAASPYAKTKVMNEQVLADLARSEQGWQFSVLRYFNPIGAHPSGLIGENPVGVPNNLVPYITQVLTGERPMLTVHGKDYETPDGTCQRDYIHVMDLARAHVRALDVAKWHSPGEVNVWNIGTGKPSSVLDVISAFERASGKQINWEFGPRRRGDLPAFWADPSKANHELALPTPYTLDQMAEDAWRYANGSRV